MNHLGKEYGDVYEDSYDEQKQVATSMGNSCMMFLGIFFLVLAVAVIAYLKTK